MIKTERTIGTQKGHRVLINYDEVGKPISFQAVDYLTPKEFEQLQRDVEVNQKMLLEQQKEQQLKLAKEQEELALKRAEIAKEEAYKKKYSIEHFLLWYSTIQLQLDHGVIELENDDGTFILLVDRVLDGEVTIENAINIHKDFTKIFESMFGGNK